jgi:hypothetical protein
MAAIEISNYLNINPKQLTLQEKIILEVEIFTRICEELTEFFWTKNKEYFAMIKQNINKEKIMFETKFLKFVVNDILMTEEYSLEGIAFHTQVPEDIICDIASGKNSTPSLYVS